MLRCSISRECRRYDSPLRMCSEWMPRTRCCAANFFFFKGVNRIRPACLVDGRGEWLLAVFCLFSSLPLFCSFLPRYDWILTSMSSDPFSSYGFCGITLRFSFRGCLDSMWWLESSRSVSLLGLCVVRLFPFFLSLPASISLLVAAAFVVFCASCLCRCCLFDGACYRRDSVCCFLGT